MTILTLTMPRLGETMDEGVVANWLVAAGQSFKRGDPLVEIETDKTLVEFPALGDGTMVEALVTPDTKLGVGEPIARISPANAVDWAESSVPEEAAMPELEAQAHAPVVVESTPTSVRDPDTPLRATPLARRLARNAGLDLKSIPGTGRRNRIERQDVEAALAGSHSTGRRPVASNEGTVLLIHGFAGDGRAWLRLATMLQRDGLTVAMPDLPGHGSNGAPATDFAALVADVEHYAASLSGDLHIVGHSLGGAVAAVLTSDIVDRVASLTLIAPAGIGRDIAVPFISGMANVQTAGELEHLLPYLGAQGGKLSDAALAEMASELAKGRLRDLASAVAGPLGQRISIIRTLEAVADRFPVKVIFGLDDRVIPAAQASGVPPAVAVHYIRGAGHMPQWDAPETVLNLIKQGALRHV